MKSEIITNADGSIYHLHLRKEHIQPHIITVGDPARVDLVAGYFDEITYTGQYREFKTVVGRYKGTPITVISTGIGTDNIDIVLNEIELLLNYDLNSGEKIGNNTVSIYRIGTSGSIQEDVDVDSIVISTYGVGLDGLMHFYDTPYSLPEKDIALKVNKKLHASLPHIKSYAQKASDALIHKFAQLGRSGITLTATGFYGPQGRLIPSAPYSHTFIDDVRQVTYDGLVITNIEMETAGIYGLANLHGHQAISLNAILANRILHTFSSDPHRIISSLVEGALEIIAS